ncbi:MAG: hypothetical protein QXX99_07550 [Candidatus Bathyarchaeia archaeon]
MNAKWTLAGEWRLIVTVALAGALLAKSLIFSSYILFSPRYISDEIYYVSAGKYFMHKLGVLPEFKPPISAGIITTNGTVTFDYMPLESEAVGISVRASSYNWANIEHPALAKIVYGALICILRNIILLRFALLIFSLVIFSLFFYTLISKYDMLGVASVAIFLLLDGVVHHLTYLAFLDTLMLALLVLSITMFLRGDKRAVIPFMFMAASKEVAVVFAIPFSLFLFLRREVRWALIYIFVATYACAFSFALNIVAASPFQIIETVAGMSRIIDPYTCKSACLLSLREEWGMFILHPALLWLWFPGLAVKMKERPKQDVWLLPYFLSLTSIIFVALVSLIRSVYVFYYAPALALSPIAIADIIKYFATSSFPSLTSKLSRIKYMMGRKVI